MITYTMYLRRDAEARPDFEPVICANDADAIRKARALLQARPGVKAVDVYFGDQLLVTVS
jgi:predicted dinucleotide-binding enzyme